MKLLVKKIISYWPKGKIIFRGDAVFCRDEMFNLCERNNIKYITGIAANNRLVNSAKPYIDKAKKLFNDFEKKQKLFGEFKYAAKIWKKIEE